MTFTIKNKELEALDGIPLFNAPKYASQLINWANQNAHGTRPNVVGRLAELFPEYAASAEKVTLQGWTQWYLDRYPDAIEDATNKIYEQMKKLKAVIQLIDTDLIRSWVKDLVISKTYSGLYVQKAILEKLAERKNTTYRLANPDEEAKGIDGFVGDEAYSVKPDTYKTMAGLPERIEVKMIYYTKTKTGLTVEVEE